MNYHIWGYTRREILETLLLSVGVLTRIALRHKASNQ